MEESIVIDQLRNYAYGLELEMAKKRQQLGVARTAWVVLALVALVEAVVIYVRG